MDGVTRGVIGVSIVNFITIGIMAGLFIYGYNKFGANKSVFGITTPQI